MTLALDLIETPIGPIALVDDGDAVRMLDFCDDDAAVRERCQARFGETEIPRHTRPGPFRDPIRAYFDGDIDALEAVPAAPRGTEFQETVWAMLRTIPPGRTSSYGALAGRIGNTRASRAVGLANARNPVSLIVPCHRVIGANGSLVGYAGGMRRKEWLLRHEGASLI